LTCQPKPQRHSRPCAAQAEQANGTVVTNAGIAPGATNLLAAEILKETPDPARSGLAILSWPGIYLQAKDGESHEQ
jgi:saccharopine dehydrogenase-like NADP-dependent oxidoreductase